MSDDDLITYNHKNALIVALYQELKPYMSSDFYIHEHDIYKILIKYDILWDNNIYIPKLLRHIIDCFTYNITFRLLRKYKISVTMLKKFNLLLYFIDEYDVSILNKYERYELSEITKAILGMNCEINNDLLTAILPYHNISIIKWIKYLLFYCFY